MSKLTSKKGRPSEYTEELATEICNTIASSSKGTKILCAEHPHWPCQDTLFTWLKIYPDFSEQYARAKKCQIELLIDEIIEIADESSGDITHNDNGEEIYNAENVARSRLRIDTRKWLACKLVPRVYGDSKTHEEQNSDTTLKKIADIVKELNQKNEYKY